MADYWVSQPKHYCETCNCWTQGDKVSIKRHEAQERHKNNVERLLKKKRNAKAHEASRERNLANQLAQIEKDALRRHQNDGAAPSTRSVPPPPPPRRAFPPPPPPSIAINLSAPPLSEAPPPPPSAHPTSTENPDVDTDVVQAVEKKSVGFYRIRGITYLEGDCHVDKLIPDAQNVQVWVEAAEEWLETTILSISNTLFTVSYNLKNGVAVSESNVSADRLRIKVVKAVPKKISISKTHDREEYKEEQKTWAREGESPVVATVKCEKKDESVVDEATGLGSWSTVSVRQVDEQEEAMQERVAKEVARRLAAEEANNNVIKEQKEDPGLGDNALSAYKPLSSSVKTYKGVALEGTDKKAVLTSEEQLLQTITSKTTFKKRKRKKDGSSIAKRRC